MKQPGDRHDRSTSSPTGPDGGGEGLLLVGHGSRSEAGEAEMRDLCALVTADLLQVDVDLGYLEMSEPPAGEVLDRLVRRGARRVVVLPLVLLSAGHAKSDVPALVVEGRQRHPDVDLRFGSPLGVSRDLVAILGDAVLGAGAGGVPLLLIARGTSDPDANGDAHKVARLVAEWTGAPFVHTGFSGVTGPSVPEALDLFGRLGYERIAVAFWYLCTGTLVQRAQGDIAAFRARSGVEVVDAGYLGPDPRLLPVVTRRYREALEGTVDQQLRRVLLPGRLAGTRRPGRPGDRRGPLPPGRLPPPPALEVGGSEVSGLHPGFRHFPLGGIQVFETHAVQVLRFVEPGVGDTVDSDGARTRVHTGTGEEAAAGLRVIGPEAEMMHAFAVLDGEQSVAVGLDQLDVGRAVLGVGATAEGRVRIRILETGELRPDRRMERQAQGLREIDDGRVDVFDQYGHVKRKLLICHVAPLGSRVVLRIGGPCPRRNEPPSMEALTGVDVE